jgi:CHRD domain-containing protein
MRIRGLTLGFAAALVAGCTSDQRAPLPTSFEARIPLFAQSAEAGGNLSTHLDGDGEVPQRPSKGQGEALLRISDDGLSVSYKLIATNLDNVFMAHLHMAAEGVNGPIVVWLFPSTTPNVTGPLGAGRFTGVLAEGSFTAANFTGPLATHPMSDLLAAIRAGNIYANVHTNDGVDGVNTGPGDFPGGEIRGQIKH